MIDVVISSDRQTDRKKLLNLCILILLTLILVACQTKTEKYLQNILNKNLNFNYNMDRALSFDYESNKIIRI